jgi:hypothetical protein
MPTFETKDSKKQKKQGIGIFQFYNVTKLNLEKFPKTNFFQK